MHRGYLALYRRYQDHPFWKAKRVFSKAEAWIDILWEAQHSEEPQQVILGMKTLTCNYGECLKSNVTWGKRWDWTESKVRRFLKLLKNMGQIDYESEGITTRINVINYAIYDPRRRANDEQTPRTRRGRDEDATTDNNDKNEKNVKKKRKKEKKSSNGDEKTAYREYVKLTAKEHDRLLKKFGMPKLEWCMDYLDNYIGAIPSERDKYTSHCRVIQGWVSERYEKEHPSDVGAKPIYQDLN